MIHAALLLLLSQIDPPSLGTKPGELDGGAPIIGALQRCNQCHDRAIGEPDDPLVLPFDGWVSTMMANSVRDPLFQAALAVANQDVPGLGSWCLRCHSTQSYVNGHTVPPDGSAFDELDNEGVTCDVCHRSTTAPDSGSPPIGNAQIYIDPSENRFGPYADIFSNFHKGTDGGVVSTSEVCGQCHQVSNPLVPWRNPDDGGILGPQFPLDTTYDEWKQSQYSSGATAKSCQDCHMPRAKRPDGGTEFVIGRFGPSRDSPRRHALVGGNLWGLEAVQKNDPACAAQYPDQFAETTRLTEESLRSAATLTVTTPETTEPGGTVLVRVRVKNNTGHKLPTGYADGRRVVVQMLLNGRIHTARFDGGYLFDDGWLRVYETQHGKLGVGVEEHLAKHDIIVKDTRLLPTGFRPPPGAATLPVPEALYAESPGVYLDYDEVVWDVDVPSNMAGGTTFDVTINLLYQATTPQYVTFLRDENRTTDAGRNLFDIWKATNEAAPFLMASVEKRIAVIVPDAGGGGGAGGGSGGSAGGSMSTGGGAGGGGGRGQLNGVCGCNASAGSALLLLLAGVVLRRRRAERSR